MLERHKIPTLKPEELARIRTMNLHRSSERASMQRYSIDELKQTRDRIGVRVQRAETAYRIVKNNIAIPKDLRDQAELIYFKAQISLEECEREIKEQEQRSHLGDVVL